MSRCICWLVWAVTLGVMAPAEAGLILNISSTTVAKGGTGSINLTVTNNGSPTNDSLGLYNFDVYINGSGTHNSPALTFVNPSNISYRSQPNYVFNNGNSAGGSVGYSNASGLAGANQEVGGGDFTIGINDVSVGNGQSFLLATLNLSASAQTTVGDVYTIQVYFGNGNFTYYEGVNSNTPQLNFGLPTGPAPTVTIIGPTGAVPEPSALAMSGLAGVIGTVSWLVARRRAVRWGRSGRV